MASDCSDSAAAIAACATVAASNKMVAAVAARLISHHRSVKKKVRFQLKNLVIFQSAVIRYLNFNSYLNFFFNNYIFLQIISKALKLKQFVVNNLFLCKIKQNCKCS